MTVRKIILDKLGAIFGAISRFDATAVYILRHEGYRAEVYMGDCL